MIRPEASIFISHVNGDPDAEEALEALVNGLKQKLSPSHDAYEIVHDREIIAGREWRRTIYGWLADCAAAVVLVSKRAFDPDKPWVSHEATVLTIVQTWRRDLCIIPVLLEGTEQLLSDRPTFKPGRLPEIQALRYPAEPHLATPDALVAAVAERLKKELPARDTRPLVGLALELRDKLSGFPAPARQAAADVLAPGDADPDAARLAERFLAAEEVAAQQGFYALCDKAREARFLEAKEAIAHILGAQAVREEHARAIAVEAAVRGAAGYGRALLLDSEDPDVLDLYLTRVTRRFPHAWEVREDALDVLEFGHAEDIKNSVRKFVGSRYGKTAGQKPSLQFLRGKATIGSLRQGGFPVLLHLDYPNQRDPEEAFHAIQDVCGDLLVLYTASPETELDPAPGPAICCLPQLGLDGYERVIGPYGALINHCRTTTPAEEKPQ